MSPMMPATVGCPRWWRPGRERKRRSGGILSWREQPRRGRAQHDQEVPALNICRVEQSSAHEPRSDRIEKPWCHRGKGQLGRRGVGRAAHDSKRHGQRTVVRRQAGARTRVDDSWHRAHSIEHRVEADSAAARVETHDVAQRELRNERAARIDPDVPIQKRGDGPREQRTRGQQHDRDRDLARRQQTSQSGAAAALAMCATEGQHRGIAGAQRRQGRGDRRERGNASGEQDQHPIRTSVSRGTPAAPNATVARTASAASAAPAAPPAHAISTASATVVAKICPRLAPMARRMASSRTRAIVRPIRIVATLAQNAPARLS